MSFSISFLDLNNDDKVLIQKEFTVKRFYEGRTESKTCFIRSRVTGDVYLPLGKWDVLYKDFPNLFKTYPSTNIKFKGELFTLKTDPKSFRDQNIVVKEAISQLSKRHSCFLHLSTGYGKTICSIFLATWSKVKTVVLAFNRTILNQWEEKFRIFTNAKIQHLKNSKEKLDPDADVYIIGLKMASKIDRSCFKGIGTVILDEVHLSTELGFCSALLKFEPLYLLGCTATPKRNDNLHKVYELYFGPSKDFIFREELDKGHTVIKYCTKFKPDIGYVTYLGKTRLNWTKIKNSLAYNPERQKEIASIVKKHPTERIIVLTDRQQEAKALYDLIGSDESELLIGRTQKYDKSKRVLIAGMKKGGVGLDHPNLTMLILATTTRDVKQFEGRLRKNKCLIYDIVDDHESLERHWKCRRRWYLHRGADIKYDNRSKSSSRGSSRRFLEKNIG